MNALTMHYLLGPPATLYLPIVAFILMSLVRAPQSVAARVRSSRIRTRI